MKQVHIMNLYKMRNNNDGLCGLCSQFLLGKYNLTGIEIGSFAGESAQIFIKTNVFQKLYCIDPWKNGYDETDIASEQNEQAQKIFNQKFKDEKRIIKIKDYSFNVIDKFSDESIDFIYIDGNHQYQFIKKDIQNYFNKIKKGGIISGHDYTHPPIQKAVNEFFKKSPLKIFEDTSWVYIK